MLQRVDTLLTDIMIYDGSGRSAYKASVGILKDTITYIGSDRPDSNKSVDCSGLALAPGFIDVHSHDDFAVLADPLMDFKVMQGVTSCIVGNCGMGPAPYDIASKKLGRFYPKVSLPTWSNFKEYAQTLTDKPSNVNVGFLIGHGTVRQTIIGNEDRRPSKKELTLMITAFEEGLTHGALGYSSGLIYEPSKYAQIDELITFAKVTATGNGIYTTHLRNEGHDLLTALDEAITIGKSAGIQVQISHHKVYGHKNWGLVKQSLAMIENARDQGLSIYADQYPYTSSSTSLESMLNNTSLSIESDDYIPAKDIIFSYSPQNPQLEGKSLLDLCQSLRLNAEQAAEILVEKGLVMVVVHSMADEDVCSVMTHSTTMIGSDGIPMQYGKPHQRLYGSFAKVLGHYSRNRGLLSLETAVQKMTHLPSKVFGLHKRGLIQEGYFADLVVFDPRNIKDTTSVTDPRCYPQGIEHVFVNGAAVVSKGQLLDTRPGKVLRNRIEQY